MIGAGKNEPFSTPDGGLAIRVINKTGAASFKGALITPISTTDMGVGLAQIDGANCTGIVYEDGIADGEYMTVVILGIAYVFFVGDSVRGHLARICATGDSGAANGKAISEVFPTSPFATDKHFQEVGHVIEARTGAGLARCMVHFN